jgi:hypothetical protein
MRLLAFLAGCALLLGAARCGQSGATQEGEAAAARRVWPDTLVLVYQDTLFLSAEKEWLLFDNLVHDSRCPAGATCVWEGNAEVGFSLYQGEGHHSFVLNTHPRFQTDTTVAAFAITVLDLTPYPHVDSTYRADQYAVQVFVDTQRR